MKTFLAQDQSDFKLKVTVSDCILPADLKHLVFTGEQYNKEGEKTQESSYNFFLTAEQVRALGENLRDSVS